MPKTKPVKTYGRIAFTEDELALLKGLVGMAQTRAAMELGLALRPEKKKFYTDALNLLGRVETKLNQPFLKDASTDAEPDEEV